MKLEAIGLVGVEHIISAFQDKDNKGHGMTVIEIREDHWDGEGDEKKILYSRSKAVSMAFEVRLEKSGGYTTVILQSEAADSSDMERIWAILTEYGKAAVSDEGSPKDIPVLVLTAIPMTLGGTYGMSAIDPIYYTLQPAGPSETACSQIRILYQPESVLFLRDNRFQTEEVIENVRLEMTPERQAEQAWHQKKLGEEELKKRRNHEAAQYRERERQRRHTFRSSGHEN